MINKNNKMDLISERRSDIKCGEKVDVNQPNNFIYPVFFIKIFVLYYPDHSLPSFLYSFFKNDFRFIFYYIYLHLYYTANTIP